MAGLRSHVAAHDEAHVGTVKVALELVAQVRLDGALLVVEGWVPPDREHSFVSDSSSGWQRSSLAIFNRRPPNIHALLLRIQGVLERRRVQVSCRPAQLKTSGVRVSCWSRDMGLQRSRTSFEPRLKPSTTFPSSLYGPIGLSCRVSGMRTAATVAAPIAARKFGAPSWLLALSPAAHVAH